MRRRNDFASASAGIRTPQKMQTPIRSDRCEHCGAWLIGPRYRSGKLLRMLSAAASCWQCWCLPDMFAYRWIDREVPSLRIRSGTSHSMTGVVE